MLYLTRGGAGTRGGSFIQHLAAHSALVRLATGIRPEDEVKSGPLRGLVLDPENHSYPIRMANVTVSVQDAQLDFYLQAQRDVLTHFPRANVILSSQPLMFDNAISTAYRPAVDPRETGEARAALAQDLDRYMAGNGTQACSVKRASELLGYFMGRSALRLPEFAAAAQKDGPSRRIMYLNAETVFPTPPDVRQLYFIDNAHLSDRGQEGMGEFFSEAILSADRGETFDYAAFVRKRQPPAALQSK
jgi:hypothetical protein